MALSEKRRVGFTLLAQRLLGYELPCIDGQHMGRILLPMQVYIYYLVYAIVCHGRHIGR